MFTVRLPRSGLGPAVIVALSAAGLLLLAARGGAAEPAKPGAAEPAAAKEYRVDPVDPTQKRNGAAAAAMLRAGQFPPNGQQLLKDYYRSILAAMTSTDEKSLEALPEVRVKILRQLKNFAKGGPVYEYLRDQVVLDYLNDMVSKPDAKGPFCHPAVRINAMVLIGEMNEKEAFGGADIPVPLSAAVPVLVAAVEAPGQIDGVRVAAMTGLLRHVRLNPKGIAAPDARALVGPAMLNLVKTVQPPSGRTLEGHAWMRGQAAEILGEMGMAGKNGAVAAAIKELVADDSMLFSARCIAARALGKLDYSAAGEFDPTPLALALGELALDACAAEAAPVTFSQPRITERIAAVLAGLRGDGEQAKGIAPLMTGDAQKKLLADLLKAVDTLNKAVKDKDVSGIGEVRLTLEELLKTDKKKEAKKDKEV